MWKWSIPNWRLNSLLIWVCLLCGFLLASPYVIYQLFRFVSPALYENEKKYSTRVVGWGYFLFMMGVLLNYFWFSSYFPFSCYLSGQYGSGEHDYFVLVYGYVDDDESDDGDCFRDPCPLLAFCQTGISYGWFYEAVSSSCYCYYSDSWSCYHSYVRCFTLMMVSVPMYLLYEVSIWIVSQTGKNSRKNPWKKCLKIMRW